MKRDNDNNSENVNSLVWSKDEFVQEVRNSSVGGRGIEELSNLKISYMALHMSEMRGRVFHHHEVVSLLKMHRQSLTGFEKFHYRYFYNLKVPLAIEMKLLRVCALKEMVYDAIVEMERYVESVYDKECFQCVLWRYNGCSYVSGVSERSYYRRLDRGMSILSYLMALKMLQYNESIALLSRDLYEDVREKITVSNMEKLVLCLAAKGLTSKEIAYQMSVKESTIETYWKRIRKKLKAENRTEAVLIAYQNGIIS